MLRYFSERLLRQHRLFSKILSKVPAFSVYSRFLVILAIILIVGVWLFVWQQIIADYNRTVEESSRETINLSQAFEEHIRRIVGGLDKDTLNLKTAYEENGIGPRLAVYMKNAAKDPSRNIIAIYDEQGIVITSINRNAIGLSFSDQEYFLVHREVDSQKLFIGRPNQKSFCGQTTIPVTRRVNKPDGSFGGIVIIGLRPDYFLSFYDKIDIGQDQLILLAGADGFTRASKAGNNTESGQDVRTADFWRNIRGGQLNATCISTNSGDNVTRLMTYRVMPDYPLVVAVAQSMAEVLADFNQAKQRYILAALLVSFFILIICGLLVSRQEALLKRGENLRQIVAERTQSLESTLNVLRKANLKLAEQATLLELATDYIVVCDLDGKIVYWNRGAESGYGWSASEVIGQNAGKLLNTQYPIPYKGVLATLQDKGRWEGEITQTCKDGRKIVVRSYQTLNQDAVGNQVAVLGINHDVTERKKYEEELARLDKLNIIGEMAASIGHEVRNPMTTVRGYLQQFARKTGSAEQREALELMIAELDRANGIITEFLGLAKNKAVKLKPTDLNLIIKSLFPLLQADALRRGNTVELELGDIPEVIADAKEMRQCILNLVGNGLEAMTEGGAVIISTVQAENRVIMTVRDHGPGMPLEIKAKLGMPFFTTKQNGTGLGLPVCYRIAHRHQATIKVETSPAGSAFHFIFNQPKAAGNDKA